MFPPAGGVCRAKESRQSVFYTIHRWDLSPGGRDGTENRLQDWRYASVIALEEAPHDERQGRSYVNGVEKHVLICYWDSGLFSPLARLWGVSTLAPLIETQRGAKMPTYYPNPTASLR